MAKWREDNTKGARNLSGKNLSGKNLCDANLRGADLSGADLSGANLYGANLYGANLYGANLSGANLSGVDLSDANLYGANLSGIDLRSIDLRSIDLRSIDLRSADLRGVDLRGVDLRGADLRSIDLSDVDLRSIDLSGADLRSIDLSGADLSGADLSGANLRGVNLSEANLSNTNLSGANLSGANLSRADLRGVNLTKASLMGVNFSGVNLRGFDFSGFDFSGTSLTGAILSRVQALDTNFTGANFTGACIEDWHINNQTKLDEVECEYIYLKYPKQERRPSDPTRNFEPGEFTKLFQKALSTVDLIFRNGVDWQALLISLEKLRIEADGAELTVQAIENKNDGAFVVRVTVPPDTDKAEIEKFLKQEYEIALKVIEARYETQLQLQGEQLQFYREEMTVKRQDNTQLIGVLQTMAENQPKYDMRGSAFGNFVDTAQAGSQQSNIQYVNMSQDLTEAAGQIQELLNQLQKSGVTVEAAQEQMATDLAKQAESNPTVMGKLVGWGKTMANKASETTVSEAAKAIVPLALKLVGIPLP